MSAETYSFVDEMANSRIYAVAGAKGGVGKTTTSLNLATSVAARGGDTVVVELDLAMANLVDFLSLETGLDDAPTVHEVLAGQADVAEAIRAAPGGIDVVPSGVTLDGFTGARVDRLPALLDPLLDEYDRIVLDTGAGLSRETVVPLALADEVVLVSTPRVAAVRDVEKTKRLAERVDTPVGGVVFTKSGTGSAPPPSELAEFLDVELLGHVPEDAAVPASQDAGEPVVAHASDSRAATAYQRIAITLDKRAVRAGSVADRSLTVPDLDAIGGRSAAEGPTVQPDTDLGERPDVETTDARDGTPTNEQPAPAETTATDPGKPDAPSTERRESATTSDRTAMADPSGSTRSQPDADESTGVSAFPDGEAATGFQFGGADRDDGGADRDDGGAEAGDRDETAGGPDERDEGLDDERDAGTDAAGGEVDGEATLDAAVADEELGGTAEPDDSGEDEEADSLRDRAKSLFGL
jgi:septum site-determining protein MinD